jgi:hypothetical protein
MEDDHKTVQMAEPLFRKTTEDRDPHAQPNKFWYEFCAFHLEQSGEGDIVTVAEALIAEMEEACTRISWRG